MADTTTARKKKQLLKLLPTDGAPIGNTALRKHLGWSPGTYFRCRDELKAEDKIILGRGRGGSVRLTKALPRKRHAKQTMACQGKAKHRASERSLYPGFLKSLENWATAQGWTSQIVQQTSDQGGRSTGGKYTRPDFVVVGSKKYEYSHGIVRDVETFEVKPLGARIDSVFEAAAHSRRATKSYLAMQVTPDEPSESEMARVESECSRFGIGLITFKDPAKVDEWRYLVDPVRAEPDPELLEEFISEQVSEANKKLIRQWLK